jgi:hypothetical protein
VVCCGVLCVVWFCVLVWCDDVCCVVWCGVVCGVLCGVVLFRPRVGHLFGSFESMRTAFHEGPLSPFCLCPMTSNEAAATKSLCSAQILCTN